MHIRECFAGLSLALYTLGRSELFFCIYNATWACGVVQLIVGCKRYWELLALQVSIELNM